MSTHDNPPVHSHEHGHDHGRDHGHGHHAHDNHGGAAHGTRKGYWTGFILSVLLTAPAKGDIPNIVYGVNDGEIAGQSIISAASCTTNAATPVLKVLTKLMGSNRGISRRCTHSPTTRT